MATAAFTDRQMRELRRLLRGRPIPSVAVAHRLMRPLERTLEREFRSQVADRARTRALSRAINAPLVELIERNPRARRVTQFLRTLPRSAPRGRRAPQWGPVRPELRSGSFVWIEVPPYDYDWTWQIVSGKPFVSVKADRNAGTMSVQLRSAEPGGAAEGRAALGIFFMPFKDGLLQFRALAAFDFDWATLSFGGLSAHTDGWIGLFAADGNARQLVNQRFPIWSRDLASLASEKDGERSGAKWSLHAEIPVTAGTNCYLWVWCGARVDASGRVTPFSGSGALGELFVSVPFMVIDFRD